MVFEIGPFHLADMLDYAIKLRERVSGTYIVGTCSEPAPTVSIDNGDGSFTQKSSGKPYTNLFQIDDTDGGRNFCNDQTNNQQGRVKK